MIARGGEEPRLLSERLEELSCDLSRCHSAMELVGEYLAWGDGPDTEHRAANATVALTLLARQIDALNDQAGALASEAKRREQAA